MFCTTHHRVHPHPFARMMAGATFLPSKVAAYYSFPKPAGALPAVAIIELGGGYNNADLKQSCDAQGIPVPSVTNVDIRGAKNAPNGDPNGADGEVALDMQVVAGVTGGMAPLLMVWAPNDDAGMSDALNWCADNAAKYAIAAVSLSWGELEKGWPAAARTKTDAAAKRCRDLGIELWASSGDNASTDGGKGNNVDYPASSPYFGGVGGTTAQVAGSKLSETVWPETGGGYSAYYKVGNAMRMVPDVAAIADPSTGFVIVIDGKTQVIGGTSAGSPLWAGLSAVIAGATGKKGALQSGLVQLPGDCFTDIVTGSNGGFKAAVGPDPCTGRGTPIGVTMAAALGTAPPPVLPPTPPPPVVVGYKHLTLIADGVTLFDKTAA